MNYQLILGSQSPRRRELLKQIGLDFAVRTADLDETVYETDDPVETVCATCAAKARAVAKAFLEETAAPAGRGRSAAQAGSGEAPAAALILTSDTIVVLDGRIMGKPHSRAEAEEMLAALSGREHSVYTAFTLLPAVPGAEARTEYEETKVRFRPLRRDEIRAYVATGEPMDKAGAYGIQGVGALLVEAIEGDYYTVMGLPLCRVALALRDWGIDALAARSISGPTTRSLDAPAARSLDAPAAPEAGSRSDS